MGGYAIDIYDSTVRHFEQHESVFAKPKTSHFLESSSYKLFGIGLRKSERSQIRNRKHMMLFVFAV